MEKQIYSNGQYQIWQMSGKEHIHELADFVVKENYKHHAGDFDCEIIQDEVESVYEEELDFADDSAYFIARHKSGSIIGTIRVFKWDRVKTLPLQRIFGINPLKEIHPEKDYSYWHIGRFAIDSFSGIPTLTLFKLLMLSAINPIICDDKSYMIAEIDSKLLKVINALGLETKQMGNSVNYLASETIPVYSSRKTLITFYRTNQNRRIFNTQKCIS